MVTGLGVLAAGSGPAVASALLAGALLGWPGGGARARVLGIGTTVSRSWSRVRFRGHPAPAALAGVGAVIGGLLAGAGGALAGAMLAFGGVRRWRAARRRRVRAAAAAGLCDALGLLVAELRAGAHPAAAATAAAADAEPSTARVLGTVAATARLGGDVAAALHRCAAVEPGLGEELVRVAGAWALATRHGVALAGLVDAVRTDLEARQRFAAALHAQLAGPRATAAVLAGLPVLGLLLGQGVGADPWHVLAGTAIGQGLLVVGVGLVWAGLAWSGRISGAVLQ